jgi:hypothetical protein
MLRTIGLVLRNSIVSHLDQRRPTVLVSWELQQEGVHLAPLKVVPAVVQVHLRAAQHALRAPHLHKHGRIRARTHHAASLGSDLP